MIQTNTTMKVNIYRIDTNEKVGSFITKAMNISKAFYTHFQANTKYGLFPTECYWELSDV